MPRAGARFKLEGDKQLQRLFKELPKRIIKKGLRAAMNAGATPVVKAAKARAPKQSGLLKKSMGKKVKTYPSGVVTAVIGPKRQTVGEYKGKKRVPGNYAHLVEKHEPFLEPAFESTKQQAEDIAADKLSESVVREAKKLGNA